MEPVELSGDLVAVEPLRTEHAPGLLVAADSDEIFAWLPYPRPADLEQARAWVEDALADRRAESRFPFAVLSASDGSVIGSTSYWDFDSHNAHVEIGSTWLSRASWRTGRNAEAKLLLMSHAFETLGLERVSFRTDIRNERSQRAIERLGAIKEGVHRHEMQRRDGSWRDSVHYSILSAEWPYAKKRLLNRLGGDRAANERSAPDLHALPEDLPGPEDDGAAEHLLNSVVPSVVLQATNGESIDLAAVADGGILVVYVYPQTGVPGQPVPAGWDRIPGARGCTPQSCAFRDSARELTNLGATVFGLSAQNIDEQREFAEREHLPYPLLNDSEFRLVEEFGLPTFEANGVRYYRRLTFIAQRGRVARVFYPVFPPQDNAADVSAWLSA